MNQTLIQYQTHNVLTNENTLTEMNHHFPKITTLTKNREGTLIQEQTKKKLENLKGIMNNYLATTKKHRVENNR